MFTNAEIVKRAEDIAARDGGPWSKHLDAALNELQQPPLEKVIRKQPVDDGLSKAAVAAQLRQLHGTGDPDPDRRVEIGECETELGRVRVAISRESISIHGVNTNLSEIDADLRDALVHTAASFAAAQTDLEQTQQKSMIGFVMDAVMRRHQCLTAKVKESKARERHGN